jgi:hypothetical protein
MALEIRQMQHVLVRAELGSFARAASVPEWRGRRFAYSSARALTRPERMALASVAWSFSVWSA